MTRFRHDADILEHMFLAKIVPFFNISDLSLASSMYSKFHFFPPTFIWLFYSKNTLLIDGIFFFFQFTNFRLRHESTVEYKVHDTKNCSIP